MAYKKVVGASLSVSELEATRAACLSVDNLKAFQGNAFPVLEQLAWDSASMRAAIDASAEWARIVKEIERNQALVRASFDATDYYASLICQVHQSPLFGDLDLVQKAMTDFHASFRLHQITETMGLIAQVQASPLLETLAKYTESASVLHRE